MSLQTHPIRHDALLPERIPARRTRQGPHGYYERSAMAYLEKGLRWWHRQKGCVEPVSARYLDNYLYQEWLYDHRPSVD